MFRSTNLIEFTRMFKENADCYAYLSEIKWKNGFECSRCKCKKEVKGYRRFDKRCQSCSYNESVTAGTLFHGVKFDILKAFHICFHLSTKKGFSTYQIAKTYGINQKSAWLFKCKFQESLTRSVQKEKLKTAVEVDEFTVGGKETNKQGRSKGKKKIAFIAVETFEKGKIGNIKMEEIKGYSKEELLTKIKVNIEPTANIKSDNFSSYKSIAKDRKNMTTDYSNNGLNFESLHKTIMNFKSWLRGIHHKVSDFHFGRYLTEFVFRHNQRNYEEGIFHSIICNFIWSKNKSAQYLRQIAD
jgi:hypothetical protein